jgi:hypothetical protein
MAPAEKVTDPERGYALVTIIGRHYYGGSSAQIWDREKFLGVVYGKTYIQYMAEPGEHLFIAIAQHWSFVKANLEAGKHYYIVARLIIGFGRKGNVVLDPVSKENVEIPDEELKIIMNEYKPFQVNEAAYDDFVNPRLEVIQDAIAKYEAGEVEFFVLETDDYRDIY